MTKPIPARILRAFLSDIIPHEFSKRDLELRGWILAGGAEYIAQHGKRDLTLTQFAEAIQVAAGSVRRLFCDLENVVGVILRDHLKMLEEVLSDISPRTRDCHARRRAAYLAHTRIGPKTLSDAHMILVRDRFLMPDDERDPTELLRASVGELLAGDHAEVAFAMLDNPVFEIEQTEAVLSLLPVPAPGRYVFPVPKTWSGPSDHLVVMRRARSEARMREWRASMEASQPPPPPKRDLSQKPDRPGLPDLSVVEPSSTGLH